jgi:hypothetical protein
MKHFLLTASLAGVLPLFAAATGPFEGRWDLTITTPKTTYPGWMQVMGDKVRVQPRSGSAFNVTGAKFDGAKLSVPLEKSGKTTWELSVSGDQISGALKMGTTEGGKISGVRAPALNRAMPKSWTKAEPLFNGKDLSGWVPDKPEVNHWKAEDGVLVNAEKGANLRTSKSFDDFKLHVELNCPENGNSGIYLRGRYEVQVEYEPAGTEDSFHSMGAIYGGVATKADVPRTPGQWEAFDITLVGRTVSVVRNGVTVIDRQEIPGITGGALDSHESEPGAFYIQGDHTGGIKFRNITISVPKK